MKMTKTRRLSVTMRSELALALQLPSFHDFEAFRDLGKFRLGLLRVHSNRVGDRLFRAVHFLALNSVS